MGDLPGRAGKGIDSSGRRRCETTLEPSYYFVVVSCE